MPKPTHEPSNGWWYFRWRDAMGRRIKTPLGKDPRWKGKGHRLEKPPADIVLIARKYEDMAIQARHGVDVRPARNTDLESHLDAYAKSYAIGRAPNSVQILAQAIRHFKAYCATHRIKTIQAVTLSVCRGFLEERASASARNTVVVFKGILAPIWTQAVEDRLIPENPWKAAKVPGKPKQEEPVFWTEDELGRLIEASEGWVRDLILVGANCGLRITSLLTLEWRDVRWDRGMISVRAAATKTGKRYEVPISEVARDVLQRRHAAGKGELVFPSPRTGRTMRPVVTYKAMRVAVRKAGLPEKGTYNHILRHTFATHAIAKGVPLVIVSKWLGHTTIHMTLKYSHMAPSESLAQMTKFNLGPGQIRTDPPPCPPEDSGNP